MLILYHKGSERAKMVETCGGEFRMGLPLRHGLHLTFGVPFTTAFNIDFQKYKFIIKLNSSIDKNTCSLADNGVVVEWWDRLKLRLACQISGTKVWLMRRNERMNGYNDDKIDIIYVYQEWLGSRFTAILHINEVSSKVK